MSRGYIYSYEGLESHVVRMPTTTGNWKRVAQRGGNELFRVPRTDAQ